MQVKHRHQSMRFDRPEATIVAALKEHRTNATVVTGTEGGNPRFLGLVKADGWGLRREPGDHNRDDVWITWNEAIWEPRVGWVQELSNETYDGRRAHVAIQKLRHREEGTRVFFMCHHLPAHIEREFKNQNLRNVRVRAYNESLRTLRELVPRLREKHPNAHFVVTGDWNLDFHKPWVPHRLGTRLAGTGLRKAAIPRGTKGTLGKRLIDWALTDLRASGDVLPHIKASDHRPVSLTYTIQRDDSPDVDGNPE